MVIEVSQTELFEPIGVYLGDGLEMAGHVVVTLGKTLCTDTVDS